MSEVKGDYESDQIWEEIKNLPLDVFALGKAKVQDHVFKIDLKGTDLYLKLSSSAVLPALESSISNQYLTRGKRYQIEPAEGFVVVKRYTDKSAAVQKAIDLMAKKSG